MHYVTSFKKINALHFVRSFESMFIKFDVGISHLNNEQIDHLLFFRGFILVLILFLVQHAYQ